MSDARQASFSNSTSNSSTERSDSLSSLMLRSRSDAATQKHGAGPTFFRKQEYCMLRHNTDVSTQNKWSCLSSSEREITILDMKSSELEDYFNEFYQSIQREIEATQPLQQEDSIENDLNITIDTKQEASTPPIDLNSLKSLVRFVQKTLPFPLMGNSNNGEKAKQFEEKLKQLFEEEKQGVLEKNNQGIFKVPLEWFIEKKIGACRHQTLFTAYLLVTLLQKTNTTGKVYRYRSALKNTSNEKISPHSLIIYETEQDGHRYLLDPSRELVINLTTLQAEAEMKKIDQFYSPYNIRQFIQEINHTYNALASISSASKAAKLQ